ncbi:hypothetical protein EMIT0P395_70153 [Pseudomonas sp. IT-P395]
MCPCTRHRSRFRRGLLSVERRQSRATAFGRFLPFVKGEKLLDGCFQINKTVEPDMPSMLCQPFMVRNGASP